MRGVEFNLMIFFVNKCVHFLIIIILLKLIITAPDLKLIQNLLSRQSSHLPCHVLRHKVRRELFSVFLCSLSILITHALYTYHAEVYLYVFLFFFFK